MPVVGDLFVDLVGHHDQIVLHRNGRDDPQLVASEDLARRIVRRIEDESSSTLGGSSPQSLLIDARRHSSIPRAHSSSRYGSVVLARAKVEVRGTAPGMLATP